MKVTLEVAQGAHQGKRIPITRAQFVIGRDPECQLRPASPLISRRHCAVLIREGQVFLHDFGSTNGVQLNGQKISGQVPLAEGDKILLDPLAFVVHIEGAAAPAKPAPARKAQSAEVTDDDSIAALLLDGNEGTASPGTEADADGVPLGSTVMEMPALSDPNKETRADNQPPVKEEKKRTGSGDTANAAKLLLEKYTKRKIV